MGFQCIKGNVLPPPGHIYSYLTLPTKPTVSSAVQYTWLASQDLLLHSSSAASILTLYSDILKDTPMQRTTLGRIYLSTYGRLGKKVLLELLSSGLHFHSSP